MYFQYSYLVLLFLELIIEVRGLVKCRRCEHKYGTCDDGECIGESCIMMEVISSSNGVRSVSKNCSPTPVQQDSCETTAITAEVEKRKCTCMGQWCNSDEELAKRNGARSRTSSMDRNKRGNYGKPGSSISTNYLVMLIFMCLFIVGSFSLLIFNTVCVHLC